MKTRIFWIFAILTILFGFITKVYAVHGNNIFFTVDEGRDAIYARQIINYHQIFTKGPQATLAGLYSGPLWYYFVSIGYSLFRGNPFGAVFMLIVLNLAAVVILMIVIKKEAGSQIALMTGFALMIFWPFFTTSLWAFNPFALVPLSIFLLILLSKGKYGLAAIIIILAFNAELAGAISLLIFYITIGAYNVIKKRISWKKYLICAFLFPLIGTSKIIIDFLRTPRTHLTTGAHHIGGTNFRQMAIEFVKIIGGALVPQNPLLGFCITVIILIVFVVITKNKFSKKYIYLTFGIIVTSYLFFGSNHGWSAWHTAYIPVLTLVAILLMCWEGKIIGKTLIIIILLLNVINFRNNYIDYLKPSPNPSLLYNQERVLDFIYTHNENDGFNLYTYTNTYHDYSYQYLIDWYAKTKYGFYPCEYSNFPLSIKDLYIPGAANYVRPQLGCDKFRFLIIDSDTNGNVNKNWINDFRNQTILVGKTQIGSTIIEKRRVPDRI